VTSWAHATWIGSAGPETCWPAAGTTPATPCLPATAGPISISTRACWVAATTCWSGRPVRGGRHHLVGGPLGGTAPASAATPGATTRRWWHGGGYPVTQQSAGEQQPDRADTSHSDDRRERRAARPEGQRAPGGADHASREHRRGGHPIGRAEGGLGAQRRGGANAGEPVAWQPPPPAEQADGEQPGASDQQQHSEQRGRRHGGQDTGGITCAYQPAGDVSARMASGSLKTCGTRG
jgi:hypothetical protein